MPMSNTQPQQPPVEMDLRLPEDVRAVVTVRRWVAAALADLDPDDVNAVLLACTELVANTYDHAHSPRRFALRRRPAIESRSDRCWRVSIIVEDGSTALPSLNSSRLGAPRGHGMVLVDQLSCDWGIRRRDHGKAVWAVLLCHSAATSLADETPAEAERLWTVGLAS